MLSPTFGSNNLIKFGNISTVFGKNTDIKKIYIDKDWNTKKETVKRIPLDTWDSFGRPDSNIYIKYADTQFSWKTDAYAIRELQEGECIYVVSKNDGSDNVKLAAIGNIADDKDREKQMKYYNKEKLRIQAVFEELLSSKRVKTYETVNVDEEWLKDFKIQAAEREEIASFSSLTPEERREVQKRMVAYTLRECVKSGYSSTKSESGFIWDKVEPRTSDLMNTETVTYYGTKEDEESLHLAAKILNLQMPTHNQVWPGRGNNQYDEQNDRPVYFWEYPPVRCYSGDEPSETYTKNQKLDWDRPQLLRVNAKVAKHIASNPYCKHIDEFFYTATDNNHFSVDPAIRRWHTGFNMTLEHDYFMEKMKHVNLDMHINYVEITDYINSTTGAYSIKNYLEKPQMKMFKKMIEFNSFLDSLDAKLDGNYKTDVSDAVKAKSRELFVFTDVTCDNVVDQDMIVAYEDMLLYLEPIALFLNSIDNIKHHIEYKETGDSFSKELNAYLGFKQRLGWKPPINLLTLNKNN